MKTRIKLSEIPKYKDSIIAFFKFTPFITDLMHGNLYMNNFRYYIDREIETGDRGVGDKLEASQVMANIKFRMYDNETGNLALEGTGARSNFRVKENEKRPVFCLFALISDNLVVVGENKEFYIAEFDYSEEAQEKMISEFGNELLIIDPNSFIERVERAFSKNGYGFVSAKVNYDDYRTNNSKRIESYLKNNNEIFFWKDKYFENQSEYRIVITNTEINKPIIVNIGDISDISTQYSAQKLFGGNIQFHLKK